MAGRYWIAIQAFSLHIPFLETILFGSATILTRLVNIIPGGIGITEGIVAGLGSLLGFDPIILAVAVGLDRIIATTVVLILGLFFSYTLSREIVNPVEDTPL